MLLRSFKFWLGDVHLQSLSQLQGTGAWRSASKATAVAAKQEAEAKPPPGPGKTLKLADLQPSIYPLDEAHATPTTPLYDRETWLEANFPQYGWKAKGPFYHWLTWARARLPEADVKLYIELDKLMSVESRRCNFIKQSMWELSRLWYWQHTRSALGLHPDPTPSQLSLEQRALKAASPPLKPEGSGLTPASNAAAAAGGAMAAADGKVAAGQGEAAAAADGDTTSSSPQWEGISTPMTAILEAVPERRPDAPGRPSRFLSRREAAELQMPRPRSAEGRPAYPVGVRWKLFRGGNLNSARRVYDDEGDEQRPLAGPADEEMVRQEALYWDEPAHAGGYLAPWKEQQQQMEGVATWGSLPVLDRTATLDRLYREFYEQSRERYMKRELSFRFHDDGYEFGLSVRPPTSYLDLLTDYLQLKYADVLARRDKVTETLRTITGVHPLGFGSLGPDGQPQFEAASVQLSPVEVQEINKAASEKLARDPLEFLDFINKLHKDRLISDEEQLACSRATEAALNQMALESSTTSDHTSDAPDPRQELLALARGEDVPSTSSAGQQLWAAAAGAHAARAEQMKAQCRADIAALRQAGTAISEEQEKELLAWWDEPISLEAASKLWGQCSAAAGVQYTPALEEVLQLEQQLRAGRGDTEGTAAAAAAGANRLLELQQEALRRQSDCTGAPPVDLRRMDVRDPRQLSEVFPLATMEGILRQHWERVSRRFLQTETGAKGPAWDELLRLMTGVYGQLLSSASSFTPTANTDEELAKDPLTSKLEAATEKLPEISENWQDFGQRVAERNRTPPKFSFGGKDAPPYPGAARIVHFDQSFVLHAGSAMLDHPLNRRVVMRVNMDELAREAGLSQQAVQHMIAVAGPRYKPDRRELLIACRRYRSREENRKWCMEALHALVHEGQAAHPSDTFLFDKIHDPYAPSTAQAAAVQP